MLVFIAIILASVLASLLYVYLKHNVIPCDCLNKGTCLNDGICSCNSGYYGDKCQKCEYY